MDLYAFLSVAAACTSATAAIVVVASIRKFERKHALSAVAHLPEVLGTLEARLNDRLDKADDQHKDRLDRIESDIATIRKDLEWLASEHVVDQAVRLARAGVQVEEDLAPEADPHPSSILQRLRRH